MTEDERRQWDGGRDYAAQRGLALDEASALLSSTSRDYNAGLLEDFLRLYDCEELAQRITRSQGLISVHNAYLPILASSTPVALASYLRDNQLWSMGWWPRYAILTPDPGLPEYRETDYLATEPAALAGTLRHLDERLPQAQWPDRPTPLTVTLGEKVLPSWKTYNKTMSYDLLLDPALDERLHGLYGRMPTHAIKVAMLLAALDWPADRVAPQIELHHLARAVDIAERWRASAHRALGQATQTEAGTLRERLLRQIASAEARGITYRDVTRRMRDQEPAAIERALSELEKMGEIERYHAAPGPRGGAPTYRYRLPID